MMFRSRRPDLKDEYVFILEGAEDTLSQKVSTLKPDSDIITVSSINAGSFGSLSHQDFIDDFIGSLSRVQKDLDSRMRAALAMSESAFVAQLDEAEARFAKLLAAERAKVETLTAELEAAKKREQVLAFKVACIATEVGGFDGVSNELGVDEASVHRWCEEKAEKERREAEAKRARTRAAMEAAAKERAEAAEKARAVEAAARIRAYK